MGKVKEAYPTPAANWIGMINDQLASALKWRDLSASLEEAIGYPFVTGGKRLRPLISCWVYSDLSKRPLNHEAVRPFVSVELLHAASLIHDDLPALDNDDFRRGRPSCHKVFGEGRALLAGDLLIGLAFDNIAKSHLPSEAKGAIIGELSHAWINLCDGQAREITDNDDIADKINIAHKKTGALFSAAFVVGALVSGCSSEDVLNHLRVLGSEIGVLFQGLDDIVDNRLEGALEESPEMLEIKKEYSRISKIFPELGLIGIDLNETAKFIDRDVLKLHL